MTHKFILIAVLVLALASMACGINFHWNFPVTKIKPGPTETTEIRVPLPKSGSGASQVQLAFGAGDLLLNPGAEEALVEGTATYNYADFKPVIDASGNQVSIRTGDVKIEGIPNFSEGVKNKWDLKLGQTPVKLEIKAGAYTGKLELGGMALEMLDITDGAADVTLKFSQPNISDMTVFRYKTGASKVNLSGLANANFENMVFKAGAGDYTLDFSGTLQRDTSVVIDCGMSSMTLVVPKGMNTRLFYDGGLSNVDVMGAWEKTDTDYILSGSGPTLTINVNMGVGSLTLRND
jgi:hypothetical protein